MVFGAPLYGQSHDMLQYGVSHRCACAKLSTKRGGGSIAPFWEGIAQCGVSQRCYRNIARYGATEHHSHCTFQDIHSVSRSQSILIQDSSFISRYRQKSSKLGCWAHNWGWTNNPELGCCNVQTTPLESECQTRAPWLKGRLPSIPRFWFFRISDNCPFSSFFMLLHRAQTAPGKSGKGPLSSKNL